MPAGIGPLVIRTGRARLPERRRAVRMNAWMIGRTTLLSPAWLRDDHAAMKEAVVQGPVEIMMLKPFTRRKPPADSQIVHPGPNPWRTPRPAGVRRDLHCFTITRTKVAPLMVAKRAFF